MAPDPEPVDEREDRGQQLRAIAHGSTPARRLAWLEEALRVALQSGALARERASRMQRES